MTNVRFIRSDQIRCLGRGFAFATAPKISLFLYFVLISSKNFYHHQVQLNGNFRLNLSIVIILSSFDVVFFSIWRIAILSFLPCPLY